MQRSGAGRLPLRLPCSLYAVALGKGFGRADQPGRFSAQLMHRVVVSTSEMRMSMM